MTTAKNIFGLRFGSNEVISPSREDLNAFLGSLKKERGTERHEDDLAAYRELVNRVNSYEQGQLHSVGREDYREKLFFSALAHSCFFDQGLTLAMEQYKYYQHAFAQLDLRKPMSFVRSAEAEMSGLNPNRKEDAAKLARLQGMVDERKKSLETLKKNRVSLSAELAAIVRYIRENLAKIEKLSEAALGVLVDVQISSSEEKRLIEDVKQHFKEQLKDALRHGPLSKEHLEQVKKDVETLEKEITNLAHEDVSSLTRLYKAIHDHIAKYAAELGGLIAKLDPQKELSVDDEKQLFSQIEESLIALVRDHQFPVKTAALHTETPYEDILADKRKELLERLFDLLQKDRRIRHERRSGKERRTLDDPDYKDAERRSGRDRRADNRR